MQGLSKIIAQVWTCQSNSCRKAPYANNQPEPMKVDDDDESCLPEVLGSSEVFCIVDDCPAFSSEVFTIVDSCLVFSSDVFSIVEFDACPASAA